MKSKLQTFQSKGDTQYYSVCESKSNAPIVIFIHGGPGGANIGLSSVMERRSTLSTHCTLIQYDQRGTGKSYENSISHRDLTISILLEDLDALVEHLQSIYKQEKVTLIGHSFGSILGVKYAQLHADKVHKYIGLSQLVDLKSSEQACTEHAFRMANEKSDSRSLKLLERAQKQFSSDNFPEYIVLQRTALARLGGFTHKGNRLHPALLYFVSALSPHYSIRDAYNIKRGMEKSTYGMWNEIMEINLNDEINKLKSESYFITGKSDIVAPANLVDDWLKKLEYKNAEFEIFEESGHSPNMEELSRFESFIASKVINS